MHRQTSLHNAFPPATTSMSSQPGNNSNNGYGSNSGGAPQSSYGLGQGPQTMSYLCAGESTCLG